MSCLCPKVSNKFIYAIIYKFEKFRGWQLLSFLLKPEFLKLLILSKTVPRQRSSKLFGDKLSLIINSKRFQINKMGCVQSCKSSQKPLVVSGIFSGRSKNPLVVSGFFSGKPLKH